MAVILAGVVMGLGATVLFDLWQLGLEKAAGIARPNWAPVGRWVANLPVLVHDDIGQVATVPGERALGWAFHYAVGVIYGVVFAVMMGPEWLAAPTLFPAWIFGLVTIGFGWFLLHPGLGLGWAASRTEAPWKVRGLGLAAHSVFGLGLWASGLVMA